MSKSSLFENKAFHRPVPSTSGFNLVPQMNSFNAVFNTKPLEAKKSREIERLLVENYQPGRTPEKEVEKDVEQLKILTSEIHAIGRQCTLLMGERVYRARGLLKSYKDGTFTTWIESTFGSRKTGYNMLAYYELYTALPHDELRERFKKLPKRTAYILASRGGNLHTKVEIIQKYHEKTHDELVILIQEKFPVSSQDKRGAKSPNTRLIDTMKKALQKLQKGKSTLTSEEQNGLVELAEMIASLINV